MGMSETKFSSLVGDVIRRLFPFLFFAVMLFGQISGFKDLGTTHAAPLFIYGKEINHSIMHFLSSHGLKARPSLDDGRRFRACTVPLKISPLYGNFQTVTVQCPDVDGWKIAVRTRTNQAVKNVSSQSASTSEIPKPKATDNIIATPLVVVMSRSVKRGTIITADDVELLPLPRKSIKHYFTHIDDVMLRKASRDLGIGQVVQVRQLELDWTIRKGQKVQIEHRVGPIQVLSEGIALMDAQLGDAVRILNVRSRREIEGRVVSEKKISIGAKMSDIYVVNSTVRR